MKNILVPTDFSTCARFAENTAIDLARKANSEIHFIHLMKTPVDWVRLPLEKEKLYPETKARIGSARDELSKLVKRASEAGVKAKEQLIFDVDREEIERHVRDFGHDFIVMGSHGTKGFKDVIGSNTQKVIRHSSVPVLVIKNNSNNNRYRKMVFASLFESMYQKSYSKIADFARLTGAKIHLLYVNTKEKFEETDEVEGRMSPYVEAYDSGMTSRHIYNAEDIETGIKKFSQKLNADVIALFTHGKSGFSQIFFNSIAGRVMNHSELPVLCVNIKNEKE